MEVGRLFGTEPASHSGPINNDREVFSRFLLPRTTDLLNVKTVVHDLGTPYVCTSSKAREGSTYLYICVAIVVALCRTVIVPIV